MTRIGYHASHEQYPPSQLLSLVRMAESAGFQSAMCSDHFHPWTERQGQSGFAWSWLGAALEATALPFGVVTVPGGWRYHPAVLAQAGATLAEMYPERFWIAAGSGELLNEHVTGQPWPSKAERNVRLREGVDIMRALWRGETVTHHGHLHVDEATLYSLPAVAPRIVGAALTPETAKWLGTWSDGLITISNDLDTVRRIIDAFHEGGGEGKPLYLQAQLSFARTSDEALQAAWDQWRAPMFPSSILSDLRLPSQFDALGSAIDRDHVRQKMPVSSEPMEHLEWLVQYRDLGFEEINLHNVCREQQAYFIDAFGSHVIDALSQ